MEALLISLITVFLTDRAMTPKSNISLVNVQFNERVVKKEPLAAPECLYVNGNLTTQSASSCSDRI